MTTTTAVSTMPRYNWRVVVKVYTGESQLVVGGLDSDRALLLLHSLTQHSKAIFMSDYYAITLSPQHTALMHMPFVVMMHECSPSD